ncbi:MAG: acetyl-CoA C-acyltransferase [Alphaproteobacteria bacterium]|nr:acetyl-CoA C-acyltransferase [Alphaproteobacteria bacterium]
MPLATSADDVVILGGARTPIGGFMGDLADVPAPELAAVTVREALRRAKTSPAAVDAVIKGTVLAAGQGQAPARQAARYGGLDDHTECTTINKMCGSGMKAVMYAYDSLKAESATTVVAGGMENMSQTPHLLPKSRTGQRLGHASLLDHMYRDGLEDAYDSGKLMGHFADDTARSYQFSRKEQDDFAITSLQRAQKAQQNGWFDAEIVEVTKTGRKGEQHTITTDQQPRTASIDRIPRLKPVFVADGTVTAANSSSISDGAASLVLTTQRRLDKLGASPVARIVGHATYAHAPAWFTTAPIHAISALLERVQWQVADVDLFEINEAFAVVTMAAMRDLQLPHDAVNIHGGACALGHPVGASGARIMLTLIGALQRTGGTRGVAALCIGGGEATAIAIELCS